MTTVQPHAFFAAGPRFRASRGMLGLAFAGALLVLGGPPTFAQQDPVAARVNGFEIRQSDLAIAEEEFGSSIPGNTAADKRDALISYYADMILMARAAEQKGMGSTTDFARRLSFAKTKLLMDILLQDEAKTAVTDAALRKVYDQAVKEMGKEEEVHARHILLETEDEAKAVAAELKKGGDFEKLAKAKSKDPGSKSDGGDLGFFTRERMVEPFAETAFKLDAGQISDPVKTQFGWHVIQLEEKRTKPVPSFDEMKEQVEAYLTRKTQQDLITKLREGAKIEKTDAAPKAQEPKKP